MSRALCIACFAFLAAARPASADVLELVDGTRLRGIDYKVTNDRATFVVEDGRSMSIERKLISAHIPSSPGEKIEFRGKQVTLREKVRVLKKETLKRRKASVVDLETWAKGATGAAEAESSFRQLGAEEQAIVLGSALSESPVESARVLAAKEIEKHGEKHGQPARGALASGLVRDRSLKVRTQCFTSLKAIADADVGEEFVPFLASSERGERVRAAQAIEAFPTRKAVPGLIQTLRFAWTDFGRGYFHQGEERAYIQDYELVSGGTGFSVIEVADPVIGKVSTGVVLDVKVSKVELFARRRALQKITGQDFGADIRRWTEWWKEHSGDAPIPASPARAR